MFDVAFTPSAIEDVEHLRKRDQKLLFGAVGEQLSHEPNVPTRNRKRLRPNQVAEWELRLGKIRVFYDVDTDEAQAEIKMVGYKEGNKLIVRGQEYLL